MADKEGQKVALVIFADDTNAANRGRMFHALHMAQELKTGGNQVEIVFAGKSVTTLPKFASNKRKKEEPFIRFAGRIFDDVKENVVACNHSCIRFEVKGPVDKAGLKVAGEGRDPVPLARYVVEGWQIINF